MLDMKVESPSVDQLRADTPHAVVRYEADALIAGCTGSRTVRYEVEEDAGTWSEAVVRLPPRYSTLHGGPGSPGPILVAPPSASAPDTSSPQ